MANRTGKGLKDETGNVYGRLTVLERVFPNANNGKQAVWKCRCICGREVNVLGIYLRSGNSRSCGCLKLERLTKHGLFSRSNPHPLKSLWHAMRTRCTNPKREDYQYYGARGIYVCERWNDFSKFIEDMGPRPSPKHTVDRIDVDGPYSPENCRWSDIPEQANNKRTSCYVTYKGDTKTVSQWAEELKMSRGTLNYRIKNWPMEKAFTEPVIKQRRNISV